MNRKVPWFFSLAASAAVTVLPSRIVAQAAHTLTPPEVYAVMHAAIRDTFGIKDEDNNTDVWLSLSTVGTVVEPGDLGQVNDLANFCPAPKPVIDAFVREPKLDAVYEEVINDLVGAQKDYTAAYFKARAVLYKNGKKTPEYEKYLEKEHAHLAAYKELATAKGSVERSVAAADLNDADRDWATEGFRAEIDRALAAMATEEYRTGFSRQERRIEVLKSSQAFGVNAVDAVMGSFVSPLSSMSPSPASWSTSTAGWVSIAYDSTQIEKRYDQEESNARGFGGLSLGFLNLLGSGADHGSYTHKVDNVYKLSYSYDVLRVQLKRPWLDSQVFFQPYDWTWGKSSNTTAFPYVAVARDVTTLRPLESPVALYDNKQIGCALLPVEVIVARNRKATATTSLDDYKLIESSGSRAFGGSLFGIFGGGGSRDWKTTKTSEDGGTVTFNVTSEGLAVIGIISQVIPPTPQPNLADKWGSNAWLPSH